MNKINKWIFYIITVIVLFSVPMVTILINTDTLKGGEEFLFKVQAFDPYDMFRGNYLDINFEEDYTREKYFENIFEDYENTAYVTISEDFDGFAYFDEVFKEKPEDTSNYYKTTVRYSEYGEEFYIETPTRYYMNENKSLDAEKIYDENIDNTYVKVRVKDGKMVIVGVYVDDVLIDTIEYTEKN